MVTSNLPFGRWGETFSDDVVAAAMIDRLVHHAEVLTLTGDSYRTRQRRQLLAKENRAADDQTHCATAISSNGYTCGVATRPSLPGWRISDLTVAAGPPSTIDQRGFSMRSGC